MSSVRLVIQGRVQGVGFRHFVQTRAAEIDIVGTVRNRSDGGVEVQAQGDPAALKTFVQVVCRGPAHARVDEVVEEWGDQAARTADFRIIA